MSVLAKLQESRIKLQKMDLKKSGNNKYAGYQYFELGDFLPQVNDIFFSLKLCGVVRFTTNEATLTITDTEDNSEIVITSPSTEVQLKGCTPIQGIGAAQTYLRRYLWVTAMEIVEHDALDATTGSDKKGIHKPTDQEGFKPDAEELKFLQGVLDEIIELENDPLQAAKKFYLSNMDNDELIYIWDKLGKYSTLRRKIKELKDEAIREAK